MNLLSVENLSKTYGERVLFKSISFGLAEGDKVALVAANGTGKTTLLNILAKRIAPDNGRVVFRNDITVGFLEQDPILDLQASVLDSLFASNTPVLKAVAEYEYCTQHHEVSADRLQHAMEQMDKLNAWDYESRSKQILGKLGIHDVDQKIAKLSGGQKKRLSLAKILIEEPDFLILDEPTNHLDVDMIEWLEGYLKSLNKTLLLVTHDRYFLDRLVNHIIELDNDTLYTYKGNYEYFLEKKEERETIFNTEVDKAKNLYKRELDWMRKQPRARGTKQKARIDSFYDTEAKAKQQKNVEQVNLAVNMSRLGGKILELNNVSKAYGDLNILKKFNYIFRKGEKVGIVGPNGVGKSTFLKLIMGEQALDAGMIETGETVVFGYYSQDGLHLKEDRRVIEVVKDIAEFIPVGNGQSLSASQFLQHFLFSPEKQYTYVSKLSGGEKRRLHLLTILMKNPNFLILDEPTNDLDLPTLSVLEEFLVNFQGCLLVVTHDRYFMDRIVDHLLVFEGDGELKDFNGSYSDYKEWKADKSKKVEIPKVAEIKPQAEVPKVSGNTNKVSYKEKREYEELEKEIEKLEIEKKQFIDKLSAGSDSHEELNNWAQSVEKITTMLDEKSLRWLELAEKMQ